MGTTLASGGNVFIPTYPCGVIYDIIEFLRCAAPLTHFASPLSPLSSPRTPKCLASEEQNIQDIKIFAFICILQVVCCSVGGEVWFGLVWFGFPAFMKEHPSGEVLSDLCRPPSRASS